MFLNPSKPLRNSWIIRCGHRTLQEKWQKCERWKSRLLEGDNVFSSLHNLESSLCPPLPAASFRNSRHKLRRGTPSSC